MTSPRPASGLLSAAARLLYLGRPLAVGDLHRLRHAPRFPRADAARIPQQGRHRDKGAQPPLTYPPSSPCLRHASLSACPSRAHPAPSAPPQPRPLPRRQPAPPPPARSSPRPPTSTRSASCSPSCSGAPSGASPAWSSPCQSPPSSGYTSSTSSTRCRATSRASSASRRPCRATARALARGRLRWTWRPSGRRDSRRTRQSHGREVEMSYCELCGLSFGVCGPRSGYKTRSHSTQAKKKESQGREGRTDGSQDFAVFFY